MRTVKKGALLLGVCGLVGILLLELGGGQVEQKRPRESFRDDMITREVVEVERRDQKLPTTVSSARTTPDDGEDTATGKYQYCIESFLLGPSMNNYVLLTEARKEFPSKTIWKDVLYFHGKT